MCVVVSKPDRERLTAFESGYEAFQTGQRTTEQQYLQEVADAATQFQRATSEAHQSAKPPEALRAAWDDYAGQLQRAADACSKRLNQSLRAYLDATADAFNTAGRKIEDPNALGVISQSLMLVASQAARWTGIGKTVTAAKPK